jgi:hypothetical protein
METRTFERALALLPSDEYRDLVTQKLCKWPPGKERPPEFFCRGPFLVEPGVYLLLAVDPKSAAYMPALDPFAGHNDSVRETLHYLTEGRDTCTDRLHVGYTGVNSTWIELVIVGPPNRNLDMDKIERLVASCIETGQEGLARISGMSVGESA